MRHNKDAVSRIADVVVARREIYGDELLDLLRNAKLTEPTIDYTGGRMAQAVEPIGRGPGHAARQMLRGRAASSSPGRHGAGRRQTLAERKAVFPGRFMIGYLLIVLFFGALLIGFAVAWSRHSDDSGDTATTWSFFKPTADSEACARADRALRRRPLPDE